MIDRASATHIPVDAYKKASTKKTWLKSLRTVAATALIVSVPSGAYADQRLILRTPTNESDVLKDVYINQGIGTLIKLAKGHDTPPKELDKLSIFGLFGFGVNNTDDYGAPVREAVAGNKNTMPRTLANIIETDPNPRVKSIAKKNPNAQLIL